MQRESEPSQLKVVGVVTFYIVAALVMILVNKAVLNNTPDLPFTFLFIQLGIAVLLLRFLALLSRTPVKRILPVEFELPVLDRSTTVKLLPFLLVGFIGLVFNTLCLANVDASFFLIARGLILPFTILISSLFTRTIPRLYVFLSAFVVTCGFFVGVAPSFSLASSAISKEPLRALLYGLISSMVLSVHVVLSKVATSQIKHGVITISYWGNLVMALGLVPFILLNGELDALRARLLSPDQQWATFVVGSAVTGVFGFLLGIANILSIKVTSPISHMFSAAAKSVIQMMLGVFFFGDIITTYRLGAITLITGGTMFYTWIQSTSGPVSTKDAEQQHESSMELEQPLLQDEKSDGSLE